MAHPPLGPIELRVLGSLVEKELATSQYPMSLRALVSACNQASNRDPVMRVGDTVVSAAIARLRGLGLVRAVTTSGSKTTRYEHLLADPGSLNPAELAVLCVLMLRGPQTHTQLRSRAARLFAGDSTVEIDDALTALCSRGPSPPVVRLPRRPNERESRYGHSLGRGDAEPIVDSLQPPVTGFERLVFVSGQRPSNPATGVEAGRDITTQTEQCLTNLRARLKAAGSDLDCVLRCRVLLLDMNELADVNSVYERIFGPHTPSRTTVQAMRFSGSGDRLEMDCIAYVP